MNNPRRLRSLRPLPYSPLPNLIRARRKETLQIQARPHGSNNLRQRALRPKFLTLLLRLLVVLEAGEALLEGDGEGDDGVAGGVLLAPLGDFRQVLVLLADVVFFAEIDEVDDGFGG
jgi:hypothetical protein